MNNLKKGDEVIVLAGKDKGKTGKIEQILKNEKVVVENINIIKKHIKPNPQFQGGIVEQPGAINISNVMLVCPSCKKSTRVDKTKLVNDKKVRSCKKCGEIIDKA